MNLPSTATAGDAAETRAAEPDPTPRPTRRRPVRAAMYLLRRGHLYTGLFLLPWVLLYGVTAFLFNHPTAFADAPTTTFDRDALRGTPMESPPPPAEVAEQVVAALRARAKGDVRYALVEPEKAKYTRDAAFATVKAGGRDVNVLIDVTGSGGTVLSRPAGAGKADDAAAPFAVGGRPAAGKGGERGGKGGGGMKGGDRGAKGGDGLKLDNPLHERVRAAVPVILERTGDPAGEVTVTSVPDLSFLMEADGMVWRVTANAQTGAVSGRPADEATGEPLSARRFLTRLHMTHGYPGEVGARWAWALVVDVMAAVLVFWALSGILMWWQIKATRWVGLVVVAASAAAATWGGVGMREIFTAGGR